MPNFEELVPGRYVVYYEKNGGVFKILDTWHESIKNLKLDDNPDLPENSPAIKVLSTEEVNSVIGKAVELGWLDKLSAIREFKEASPIVRSKTLQEIAMDNIKSIANNTAASVGVDQGVAREAIIAIREVINKL